MLHPGRVEGVPPAAPVVARKLKVEALMRHAHGDPTDAGPGVEPGAQGVKGSVVGRAREPSEAECCSQELAALVEHGTPWPGPAGGGWCLRDVGGLGGDGSSMTWSAWRMTVCGIVRPSAFAVLRLMTSSNFV